MNEAPPVVASHQVYLSKTTAEIRTRTIPWEGYQRASLITEDELAQIRQFEKSPSEIALNESGQEYISLFLNLLQKLVRVDTIQNILVLIDDIAEENCSRFFVLKDSQLLFSPFIKLLRKDDEYIQLKSAKICVNLLINAAPSFLDFDPSELFNWISTQLSSTNANIVDISVQFLQSLLSIVPYRMLFFNNLPAMTTLIEIVKKSSQAQMQYQSIYVMWLLTFEPDIAGKVQAKYNIIPSLLEVAKSAIKEKVVRIVLSTFKNMLLKAPATSENMVAFLGNKAPATFEVLSARQWADEEISEDLTYLKTELAKIVANLSTFDEYSAEVRAGKLEWSPAHNSEQFWKQNAARMNERDNELLRALSRLISTSKDPTVLAIAAHDFGQYLKHYPSGKKAVQDIGAKTQIMELMTHTDPEVRYQALLAVQKLMANVWEV